MPWLLMYVFFGVFFVIYMIAILCHTQEYFTYCTTPTRIIVETAQSLVKPRAIRKLLGDLPMGFKFNTWHFKSCGYACTDIWGKKCHVALIYILMPINTEIWPFPAVYLLFQGNTCLQLSAWRLMLGLQTHLHTLLCFSSLCQFKE